MDTGSILLILSLALLVGIFITRPFFSDKSTTLWDEFTDGESQRIDREYSSLLAEKERLLTALQELDSNQSMGEIPDEDYPTQRTALLTAAAKVLRRLDELDYQRLMAKYPNNAANYNPSAQMLENTPVVERNLDEIEEMISARRRARNEKSAGFCPHCGKVIQKSDLYCPTCGSKVVV
ncbi:MAG TPA: zinc ribbon domain-containing protein [Leptolinea sp.]